jgi:alkanesulfonate monooxygenase SsuD/methylene tetrahydromethanopterin reductase-like flavin-dependent oxidoreductase (luciferase family)
MRIGISLSSSYNVEDPREGARWMVERAAAAEQAQLDSLFVGDHHVTPQTYYQNVPILGRLLAEWGGRPAGALFLLPLWHPVLLAEQVSTLAAIARGRFVVQAALGYGEEQFDGMGVPMRQRPSRFEQSVELVRRLLAGETVSHEGRWRFRGARIAPLPCEPVEIWIGASAEPAIDRAARIGDAWVAWPGLTPDEARDQAALYLERCRAYGRQPSTVAIRRDVYVGDSDEEAEATAGAVLARGYRGFDRSALVVGSPRTVSERFRDLEEMGYTDVLIRNLVPDQAHALASIERLVDVRIALLPDRP